MEKENCSPKEARYDDLSVVFLNCTLKKSPETSHTERLIDVSKKIFEKNGVKTEVIRPVDHHIAFGMDTDMTEKGWDRDDWPKLFKKVIDADILILCTPIWLGQVSAVCKLIIERLYAHSGETNDKGQYRFYGKTGGTIITGNEDGIKHCAMEILYSLQHVGYTIPPQADSGWIGEAGPGPSYGDKKEGDGKVGVDNDFTNRNTTFMTWNMMHFARMLKDSKGIPAHGNRPEEWKAGCSLDFPNPEYRQ